MITSGALLLAQQKLRIIRGHFKGSFFEIENVPFFEVRAAPPAALFCRDALEGVRQADKLSHLFLPGREAADLQGC